MKLYKFRSLSDMGVILDIVLNERLHCAHYKDLNDPFEGLFYSVIRSSSLASPLTSPFSSIFSPIFTGGVKSKKRKSVSDILDENKEIRVCSLSSSLNDVRMWSHYADNHQGVAIEIDFEGFEKDIIEVKYDANLPEFSESLKIAPTPKDILSIKTKHWNYENEYRIIQGEQFYDLSGRITGVYTGIRISKLHSGLLLKAAPSVQIYSTKLNEIKVIVEPNKPL